MLNYDVISHSALMLTMVKIRKAYINNPYSTTCSMPFTGSCFLKYEIKNPGRTYSLSARIHVSLP